MTTVVLDATHIDSARGRILLVWRRPAEKKIQGCVLIVPPFAEEMNKSRPMLNAVAVRLAQRGWASVLPDLYGTGDSEGHFVDARWDDWLEDLKHTAAWSAVQLAPVNGLLAVRLGAELCADAVVRTFLPAVRRTAFWQPVLDRARFLTQFLRLRTAALLMQSDRREGMDDILKQLMSGQSVEVAGYRLGPELARAMAEGPSRTILPPGLGQVSWLELQREASRPVASASRKIIDASISAGMVVKDQVHAGEPFWNSTEIVRNTVLVDATVEALA